MDQGFEKYIYIQMFKIVGVIKKDLGKSSLFVETVLKIFFLFHDLCIFVFIGVVRCIL